MFPENKSVSVDFVKSCALSIPLYLKCDFRPEKAVLDCIRALELDPNNSKAFYRRGLAYQALKEFRKAHDDLLAAFKLDSANTAIQKELVKVERSLGLLPQVIFRSILSIA